MRECPCAPDGIPEHRHAACEGSGVVPAGFACCEACDGRGAAWERAAGQQVLWTSCDCCAGAGRVDARSSLTKAMARVVDGAVVRELPGGVEITFDFEAMLLEALGDR